ncbi:glycosyltransferase [Mesobacillus zeae]|nr:glycosyltransferase [Mesobacillus zeae]
MDKRYSELERLRENLECRKKIDKWGTYNSTSPIKKEILKKLETILESQPEKTIFVFPSLLDWNIPLFQRPQHIALNLAKEGVLYLFGTANVYDQVDTIEEISPHCFLVNMKDPVIEDAVFSFLQDLSNRVIVHLYSGDLTRGNEFVRECIERGFELLYEYIDELSPAISGIPISRRIMERHSCILSDPSCYVIATADKLYKDILDTREPIRSALITNGVDYLHFSEKAKDSRTPLMDHIINEKKPIIGYFGALASWFDYDLMEKLAQSKVDYQLVLIGLDYDQSINKSRLLAYPNVHYLGAVPYDQLPFYAQKFDISVIPFLINEVTISTSPIKLFEYMAVGRPIVTTALPECLKYKTVFVANNHTDFLEKVEYALSAKSDVHLKDALQKEARKNTWNDKAKAILKLLIIE